MVGIEELKNYDPNKIILGAGRTIKYLKLGKISKVYIANNAPKDVVEDIKYYATLSNAKVEQLSISNEELRVILKKPFKVCVVSILK